MLTNGCVIVKIMKETKVYLNEDYDNDSVLFEIFLTFRFAFSRLN